MINNDKDVKKSNGHFSDGNCTSCFIYLDQ